MKYRRLNTILILDDKSRKKTLDLAGKIGTEQEEIFHIDDRNYFSHITVYSPEFPEKNIPKIFEKVEAIVGTIRKFDLLVVGLNAEDGIVILDFKKTDKLVRIHKQIIEVLNPLREGRIRDKYLARIKDSKYSKEQIEMVQNYGYPNILRLYRPHLTLGKLNSQESAEMFIQKSRAGKGWNTVKIVKVGISEMGSNGTCSNIIKEFDLK